MAGHRVKVGREVSGPAQRVEEEKAPVPLNIQPRQHRRHPAQGRRDQRIRRGKQRRPLHRRQSGPRCNIRYHIFASLFVSFPVFTFSPSRFPLFTTTRLRPASRHRHRHRPPLHRQCAVSIWPIPIGLTSQRIEPDKPQKLKYWWISIAERQNQHHEANAGRSFHQCGESAFA